MVTFPSGAVAVEAHDEGVGFVACGVEVVDVAGVEDIEAAVGGGEGAALGAEGFAPRGQCFGVQYFFTKIQGANPAADGKGLSIGLARRRLGP